MDSKRRSLFIILWVVWGGDFDNLVKKHTLLAEGTWEVIGD